MPYLTISGIASKLGLKNHQVDWILRTHSIPSVGRIGRYRVYNEEAVRLIEQELASKGHGQALDKAPATGPAYPALVEV